jgi:hypothetical protein
VTDAARLSDIEQKLRCWGYLSHYPDAEHDVAWLLEQLAEPDARIAETGGTTTAKRVGVLREGPPQRLLTIVMLRPSRLSFVLILTSSTNAAIKKSPIPSGWDGSDVGTVGAETGLPALWIATTNAPVWDARSNVTGPTPSA